MAMAVNRTAIIANSTASGVIPPAKVVAAPIDRAVATAGAMWVIDWNRTSGSPIASRSSDGAAAPSAGRSFAVILTLLSMPRSAGNAGPPMLGRIRTKSYALTRRWGRGTGGSDVNATV